MSSLPNPSNAKAYLRRLQNQSFPRTENLEAQSGSEAIGDYPAG